MAKAVHYRGATAIDADLWVHLVPLVRTGASSYGDLVDDVLTTKYCVDERIGVDGVTHGAHLFN